MIEDRPLFRPQVGAALGTSETSAGRMLVELRALALRTFRIRESCLEKEPQTGFVIGKGLVEVENGEAGRLHGRGGKYLKATHLVPSCQGIVTIFF